MDASVKPYMDALEAANLPDWFDWTARMSRGRRLTCHLKNGKVTIAVPSGVAPDRVVTFVQANLGKIRPLVRKSEEIAFRNPVKELVGGEGYTLFGRNYRLRLVDDGPAFEVVTAPTWSHKSEWLQLRRDVASAETIVEWYRAEGQRWMDEYAPALCSRLGVHPAPTFRVRRLDLRSPCSFATYLPKTHTVSVHWAAFQADRNLVEYLVAHEVAHSARPKGKPHGPAWQRLVGRLVFDWEEKREKLRAEGRELWWGHTAEREPEPEPVPEPATVPVGVGRQRSIFDELGALS